MGADISGTVGYYLSRSSPWSHNAAYTVMGWFYLETDLDTYSHFLHVGGSEGYDGNTDVIGADNDGVTLRGGCAGGSSNSWQVDSALSLGDWFHVALIRSSATDLKLYLDGVSVLTFTPDVSGRTGSSLFTLGQYNGLPINGRLAAVKAWTAALSVGELSNEAGSIGPVRSANLWGAWPMVDNATLVNDISGNSRHLTINGTVPWIADPPLGSTERHQTRRMIQAGGFY